MIWVFLLLLLETRLLSSFFTTPVSLTGYAAAGVLDEDFLFVSSNNAYLARSRCKQPMEWMYAMPQATFCAITMKADWSTERFRSICWRSGRARVGR